ncbi:type II toxin-antitoxin system mRNA interferase toxin, RelE/StbE family [Sphingomonas sp. MAH-20]|uniref:Type II toxin-antitoxin system mRNA interferase toxin, RelE/StbE family n=1 Tax=Sphingomonas horti TaxID=2682842 RepID=A0A6I4J3I6_9SPHN|nr:MULTISPECIES: type II toxin-antitoxin system RelE/ParE family toxin [Sphingomonas]MBA2918617.1 type II toxin-antitoxin system RelE/ParE family toxin [Sphingomonas sp. CGMCC 1.13658]MVO78648.1 type II toxin-antitoxin system mRNA interferase toxin, RelE/StbE family [Sphingomonas horti]
MKTYELDFVEAALKEWRKLDDSVRAQFRKKLSERVRNPHVPSARLSGLPNCYKIKLRRVGYRLVYQVEDDQLVVIVIAIGRRDRNEAYNIAAGRLDN